MQMILLSLTSALIDQEFESTVKQGTPYKLIFTPLETIDNTSGLISFRVKEGVKADGTQINFIIQ